MKRESKTALITGASGGIGRELAIIMARDRVNLILVDKDAGGLESLESQIHHTFPDLKIQLIVCDLSDQKAADDIYARVETSGMQVNYLVNNAGLGTLGFFSETAWQRENAMIMLHVSTLTRLTKLFLPAMLRAKSGKIMNLASVAGFMPSPLMAVYNATKAYVLSFSEALANELEGSGVTVTALCPGLTRTGFQEEVGGTASFTRSSRLSASAESVAAYGYRAMLNGKVVAVPGLINQIAAKTSRILPRSAVTRLVRRTQERNHGIRKKHG